ncbi:hypothetical protein AUK04_01780 [Candidatus Roizmanbacteria bacterium CG2_30_33_16]|uniref:Glycosyltransferase n=5 Tax=Candidatus Roizmaniibacteriota TaxID=1752723 RepID=A0A2M7E3F4_9BACT|nr:glycosyltransferase family 2 protein [Candidatus Roizmanbacteria bacterium]OIP84998.1 MAG: hypothetical protein AUK04_01780 [Candidatus Roizmanbacteria bacterium CG2_30_33_16]PIP64506.1 MAG: glycosyltransferase [Candidatus Roizmanbacteria bacterium CG22_combo_CG10-13_8_21_14_all_33_16]PIV62257.1 MAG: glycosyltransferase [Candidatus Roizmanbacteria bacterium CG01_land_8_20_14_3_00_33_9]PIX69489.1 MAG: glycosyltransferase [Candidatus Roizmanbacteria bacterium CG_4_10_14_3_um_filter_33_21]PJB8
MISIIIPFYNEKESIPLLLEEIKKVKKNITDEIEVILVDDGSIDSYRLTVNSDQEKNHNQIKLIRHRKRFGKGRALQTGLDQSKGEIIVFMDADLQDDPADLTKFIEKINSGYDLVNGVRNERRDSIIVKIYSRIANWFLKTVLHSPYSDINCGYKVFRKEVLKEIVFYANNFRFFPLAVFLQGYKVAEININNRQRKFGASKFGTGKLFVGIFDTLTAYFIFRFSESPLHFFGPIGGIIFGSGFVISFYLVFERVFFNQLLYRRPMFQIGILLIIVGIQIIMTGMIGELIVYLNKEKKISADRKTD